MVALVGSGKSASCASWVESIWLPSGSVIEMGLELGRIALSIGAVIATWSVGK